MACTCWNTVPIAGDGQTAKVRNVSTTGSPLFMFHFGAISLILLREHEQFFLVAIQWIGDPSKDSNPPRNRGRHKFGHLDRHPT